MTFFQPRVWCRDLTAKDTRLYLANIFSALHQREAESFHRRLKITKSRTFGISSRALTRHTRSLIKYDPGSVMLEINIYSGLALSKVRSHFTLTCNTLCQCAKATIDSGVDL